MPHGPGLACSDPSGPVRPQADLTRQPWRAVVHAEQRLLRQALVAALERLPHVTGVSSARDRADCLMRCTTEKPRIVLIVAKPHEEQAALDLVGALRVRCHRSHVVLVAAEPDTPLLHAAERVGAALVLPLAADTDELASWIARLLCCREPVPLAAWLELLATHTRPRELPAAPMRHRLSRRQHHLLVLLSRGLTNAAIADELGITAKTVRNHMTGLYARLGVSSRTEALFVALTGNLVSLDDDRT